MTATVQRAHGTEMALLMLVIVSVMFIGRPGHVGRRAKEGVIILNTGADDIQIHPTPANKAIHTIEPLVVSGHQEARKERAY